MQKELSKEEIYQLIKADAKREKVIALIQEYADQQAKKKAIAFAEWLNGEHVSVVDNIWKKVSENDASKLDDTEYTTEQLYEMFKNTPKEIQKNDK